ncbi:MAG: DUF6209 family protein [Polyangiales bacterium]
MRNALPLLCLLAASCAPEGAVDEGGFAQELATDATITFDAQWNERLQGALVAGRSVRIAYDAARLRGCRGEMYGRPAWSITGWMRGANGVAQSFTVAPTEGETVTVALPRVAGPVSFWFQNNNRWGCNAWDSDHGNNYTFTVGPDPRSPGWIGDAAVVISRATCDGTACEADRRSLDAPWRYDTYARQRAALRAVFFDVWKEGVTDRDNPSLWQQLDVRLYYRLRAHDEFAYRPVNFDRRVGNNARYRFDLATLDPLADSPTPSEGCPAAELSPDPDGVYVSAEVEYYVTVNGVTLRTPAGENFRGRYTNYRTARLERCF